LKLVVSWRLFRGEVYKIEITRVRYGKVWSRRIATNMLVMFGGVASGVMWLGLGIWGSAVVREGLGS